MRLYLIRHADAVPHGTPGYTEERRPLTAQGRQQAADVAQALKRLDVPLQAVAASPYVRAVETAQAIRQVFDVSLREVPALRSESDPREASMAMKPFTSEAHVACVGHEPHISAWLSLLTTGHPDTLRCQFKKAAVACVEVGEIPPPAGSGTLRWFLTPKQMRLIGEAR